LATVLWAPCAIPGLTAEDCNQLAQVRPIRTSPLAWRCCRVRHLSPPPMGCGKTIGRSWLSCAGWDKRNNRLKLEILHSWVPSRQTPGQLGPGRGQRVVQVPQPGWSGLRRENTAWTLAVPLLSLTPVSTLSSPRAVRPSGRSLYVPGAGICGFPAKAALVAGHPVPAPATAAMGKIPLPPCDHLT